MIDDKTLAMLGDKGAAERLTERGQLVPCPLCGESDNIRISNYGEQRWSANCYCRKDLLPTSVCVYGTNKEELIRKWNTRAPILLPEQIKRLEEATHDE